MVSGFVSVIIPIFNVKKYLLKSVGSVVSQTYSKLQIILVDDGAEDGSALVCDKLSELDNRIEVIHKANGGLSSARNTGLQAAKGEYIFFFDADDYIDSKLVETCVNIINKQACDIVVFNYTLENENNEIIRTTKFQERVYCLHTRKEKIRFLTDVQIEYDNLGWNAWNRFYRAKILQDNKIYFPDNKQIFAEDLAYAMRVCLYLDKLCIISKSLYHYVIRKDSIMGKLKKNPIDKFINLCLDFESFAESRGFKNEISILKEFIFIKILYFELKKSCLNYKEIAKYLDTMAEGEREKVRNWFTSIKYHQIFSSHFNIQALFMYCEIYLLNCVLKEKREDVTLQYLIWRQISYLKNKKVFLVDQIKIFHQRIHKSLKIGLERRQPVTKPPDAFLIGTEDFGNLGDHQIAVAEIKFLRQFFDNVIEIPASKYFDRATQLMLIKKITSSDIIFFTGGGNFGNVYAMARKIRIDVIKKWNRNIKIVMPQTAYYTPDKKGKRALKHDVRMFTQKKRVTIIAREQESYSFLTKFFCCDILFVPDIVLYFSYSDRTEVREDLALLCLRSDCESILDEDTKKVYAELMESFFSKVEFIDTQKPYSITVDQRDEALKEIFSKIQSAKIVITDRLHGMIFCAITGTPCLVLENYNHKIRGSYSWLEKLPYIKLVRNIQEARNVIETGFWQKQYRYDDSLYTPKYKVIIENIYKQERK